MKFIKLIDDVGKIMLVNLTEIACVYFDPDLCSYCIDLKSGDTFYLSANFDINSLLFLVI